LKKKKMGISHWRKRCGHKVDHLRRTSEGYNPLLSYEQKEEERAEDCVL